MPLLETGKGILLLLRLCLGELILAYAAEGAYPVSGEVFKGCAGSDAVFGITYCGVVFIPANVTNVLHNSCWLKM